MQTITTPITTGTDLADNTSTRVQMDLHAAMKALTTRGIDATAEYNEHADAGRIIAGDVTAIIKSEWGGERFVLINSATATTDGGSLVEDCISNGRFVARKIAEAL